MISIVRRKFINDMQKVADKNRAKSRAYMRQARSCDNREDYNYWRIRALDYRDFAEDIEALEDIYKLV